MIKYITLFLSIIAAIIFSSCSEEVQGPGTESYNIVFKVTPDTINIRVGDTVNLKGILKDTLLTGRNNLPLPDKKIIWQVIMGGGSLSNTEGDNITYYSNSKITQPRATAIIKAFPKIDVRHQRYVVINLFNYDPSTDTGICFRRDILPIFNSNCAVSGCHNKAKAEEGYILDSYQNIIRKGIKPRNVRDSKIYEVITEQSDEEDDRMPPPPRKRLTTQQISLIARWIAEGAVDKECSDTPIGGCDTTTVTFTKSIVPVLELNCIGCHSNVDPQGKITLEGYQNVKKLVDNGKFIGAIKHLPNFVPMPDNNMKLSDCNLRQLEIWISNGAPNN